MQGLSKIGYQDLLGPRAPELGPRAPKKTKGSVSLVPGSLSLVPGSLYLSGLWVIRFGPWVPDIFRYQDMVSFVGEEAFPQGWRNNAEEPENFLC